MSSNRVNTDLSTFIISPDDSHLLQTHLRYQW